MDLLLSRYLLCAGQHTGHELPGALGAAEIKPEWTLPWLKDQLEGKEAASSLYGWLAGTWPFGVIRRVGSDC